MQFRLYDPPVDWRELLSRGLLSRRLSRRKPAPVIEESPFRILTNKTWIAEHEFAGRRVIAEPLRGVGSRFPATLRRLALWRYDAVFVDGESRWLMTLCAIKKLIRCRQCRIMASDIILNRPENFTGQVKFRFRRWLLREVDSFVLYYRDTSELQRLFSIPSHKIHYVPFKPNTLQDLLRIRPREGDYFLAPGRSNRDLRTLFAAFESLPYKCTVLARWSELELHGTKVQGCRFPPNVTLVSDDGSTKSWNDWVANARAVIIPIEPGKLSPSGIGTYLVAMALGKCVIITEGPATRQILTDQTAVLIPPQDAPSLEAAVRKVAEDEPFRRSVGARGREYALSLGGEDRLRRDLVAELSKLLTARTDNAMV